jgi:hypothetical protein
MSRPQLMLNDFSVQKKTVQLASADKENSGKYSLVFSFDAITEVLITFYFLVREITEQQTSLTTK